MIKVDFTASAPTAGQKEEEENHPRGISSWLNWEEMEPAQEGAREDSNVVKHNQHPLSLLTCQTQLTPDK